MTVKIVSRGVADQRPGSVPRDSRDVNIEDLSKIAQKEPANLRHAPVQGEPGAIESFTSVSSLV